MNERGSANRLLISASRRLRCVLDASTIPSSHIFIFAAFFAFRAAHGKSVPLKIASLHSFPRLCLRFSLLRPTRATCKYSLRRTIARASDTSPRVPSVSRGMRGISSSAGSPISPLGVSVGSRRSFLTRDARQVTPSHPEGGRLSRRDFRILRTFLSRFRQDAMSLSQRETAPSRKCHRLVTEFDNRVMDIGGTGEREREREREREQFYVPNCRIDFDLNSKSRSRREASLMS